VEPFAELASIQRGDSRADGLDEQRQPSYNKTVSAARRIRAAWSAYTM
jgi:hypothetical protein